MMKRRTVIGGLAAMGTAVAAGRSLAQAGASLKFGFFGPFTGAFAANGQRFHEAAELFLDQANAASGVAGRKLELEFQDDRGDPLQASNIAQKFASDDQMLAAIGSFTSTTSMSAGEVFAKARMPQVSPTSSHPDYTKISPFQFRLPNTQDIVAQLNADMIVRKLGAKRVALPYYQDDWGIFTGQATKAEIEKLGGEVVLIEAMTQQARDFRAMITKLRALGADGVFIASHAGPSSIFMQQLRQSGLEIPVAGADPLYNPEFLKLAGGAAEGLVCSTYYFPSDPSKAAFTDGFSKKFGRLPDQWAAFAYDAVAITAAAVEYLAKSGTPVTREGIRDALATMPPFMGATGETRFVNGTPHKPMTLLVVRNGAYALYV